MKKNFATVFAGFLLSLAFIELASAATITSNGTGGGLWSATTTWSGATVPTSSDDVIILGSDSVYITASGSALSLTLNAGAKFALNATSLTVPGTSWNFDVTSTVFYNGPTTVQTAMTYGNLVYSSANGGPAAGTTLNIAGDLTSTTNALRGIAATSGTTVINVAGNVYTTGAGRITGVNNSGASSSICTWNINGNLSLLGSTSRLQVYESGGTFTGSSIFNINGNLSLVTGSQIYYKSSSSTTADYPEGVINLKGNFIQNGNITIPSVSSGTAKGLTINFNGTSAQTWSGAGTLPTSTFPVNVKVNNATGVTLSKAIAISGALTLTSGTITTTSTNLITLSAGATTSGASSSSYVNGPLVITSAASSAAQVLSFPVGAGTSYRPIVLTLTQTAATATPFTAQIINGSVPSNAIAATDDKVSSVGYVTLSGSNVASATVQLSYIAADNITDIANLRIAQGPVAGGGTWVDIGGTGSAIPAGTITSTSITDLTTNTAFILANSLGGSNLPVQLTSFTAVASGLNASLSWKTATETNNAGFAIERRASGSSTWSQVGYVNGNGTSAIAHSYSYIDASASAGTYDYRLKQIDADGTSSYSSESEVIVGSAAKALSLNNYPNPFNPATSILFSVPADGNTIVKIYNIIGQEVATAFTGVATAGKYYKASFDGSRLASGVYYYSIQNNGQKMVKKMLMVK